MNRIVFLSFIVLILSSCSTQKEVAKQNISSSNNLEVTKENTTANYSDISKQNILYIVDNKEVDANFIRKINPNTIKSVTVFKNKEEMMKYTSKEYDGVIIINLKK